MATRTLTGPASWVADSRALQQLQDRRLTQQRPGHGRLCRVQRTDCMLAESTGLPPAQHPGRVLVRTCFSMGLGLGRGMSASPELPAAAPEVAAA